eukprot:4641590-Amphidinium_carterae.1
MQNEGKEQIEDQRFFWYYSHLWSGIVRSTNLLHVESYYSVGKQVDFGIDSQLCKVLQQNSLLIYRTVHVCRAERDEESVPKAPSPVGSPPQSPSSPTSPMKQIDSNELGCKRSYLGP